MGEIRNARCLLLHGRWRQYGDPQVDPICRSRTGFITPIMHWILYADPQVDPMWRSLTDDRYHYEPGALQEVSEGRTLWNYSIVSERDDLIVGALRQKNHPSDTQVVVIDRKNMTLMKTVVQGSLRFTAFGVCTFSR
jgi:hypothetical protein